MRCALVGLLSALTAVAADRAFLINTIAGSDLVGDGGPALAAQFGSAESLTFDAAGNLYVADPVDHRVRKITPAGIISTVAGNGHPGFAGDGGPASAALLASPYGLAADRFGNLYIADRGNGRVRKVAPDGQISTAVGGELSANLVAPRNLALDSDGNLYISDFGDHRVYKVTPGGRISVVAGTGVPAYSGDGGPALSAALSYPAGLAVDTAGALYIADSGNSRIRKVWQGTISTAFGSPDTMSSPTGLAFDAAGNLWVAESGNKRILKFPIGAVAASNISPVRDVAVDAAGNIYVASGARVVRLTGTGRVDTVAGDGTYAFRGDGGPATAARLDSPFGLALDAAGTLYITDQGNQRVRTVSRSGAITTVVGPTDLSAPAGLALDGKGNLYIADYLGNRVRKMLPGGIVGTAAGTGRAGFAGDGGPAPQAEVNRPVGLASDGASNVFIADSNNHRVRKLTPGGLLVSVAGNGVRGSAPGQLDTPKGIAVDRDGNLFIADSGNHAIRSVTPAGAMTTVAGPAAHLNFPAGVAVDAAGSLFVADTGNHRIVMIPAGGEPQTIAGTGTRGFSGDGGLATAAQLDSPSAVLVDTDGSLYVADHQNRRVRKLIPTAALVPIIAPDPVRILTVVNAASLQEGPVAPGEMVTIFGAGFAAAQVSFDDKPARLVYTDEKEVNAQVPSEFTGRASAALQLVSKEGVKAIATVAVTEAAIGIFTMNGGTGPAAALNEDGSLNSASNPASRGSIVSLFATGEGTSALPVAVRVGDYTAEILYAGPAPGLPGLMQVNARVPAGFAPAGTLPVVLTVGASTSQQGVTIAVR